jgi:hopanoid C-3 methylase
MKILFLRPNTSTETIGLKHIMILEPLELEILATIVQKDHSVKIVDLVLEKLPAIHFIKKFKPDVVCVTGYITHINEIIKICADVKAFNPDIITITGGIYIEKVPEAAESKFIDFRVIRNAVQAFPQLILYLNQKSSFPAGVLKQGEKLNESVLPEFDFSLPIPDRQLTQKYRSKYFYVFHKKVALIKTSFGCPYSCSFCFNRKITNDNYAERNLDEVIEEIKTIHEKEIYIVDDNFLVSEKRLTKFFQLLEINNIRKKYLLFGRADFIAGHPDIMREFHKHGLRTVIIGIESFNDHDLNSFNKRSLAKTNENAIKILHDNKIECYASVITMPEWDKSDFDRATRKMIEMRISFLNIQPLTPLEKTDLVFDETRLIINRKDFAKWDLAHIVVNPQKMTVQEYYREIIRMYRRVGFYPSNILNLFKYSLFMQLRFIRGALKVRRQYLEL